MLAPVYAALAAAALFYVFLPVVGAFLARAQWQAFRRALASAAGLPALDASLLSSPCSNLGRYKAWGEAEAIEGENRLWVRSNGLSFVADLRGAWVYTLSRDDKPGGRRGGGYDRDSVERVRWTALPSLAPRARVFVAGQARMADGRLVVGEGREAPLVILHDGSDDELVRRAIYAGRHDNEYWNPITKVSLALGVLAMSAIVLFSFTSRTPALVGAIVLTAGLSPVLPLLPPGVAGFFVYRRLWKRARHYRASRDVARLRPETQARAALFKARAAWITLASACSFSLAVAINAWLLIGTLWRLL